MSSEINLLYSKRQLHKNKLLKQVRIFRNVSLGMLALAVFASTAVFILIASSPIPSLKDKEQQLTQSLQKSQEQIAQQTLLTNRINDAAVIVQKRSHYDEVFSLLLSKLPKDLKMTAFSVEKKDIQLALTTSDVRTIQSYIEELGLIIANKKSVEQATLNSFSYEDAEAVKTPQSEDKPVISSFTVQISLKLL